MKNGVLTSLFEFVENFAKDSSMRLSVRMGDQDIHVAACWFSSTIWTTRHGGKSGVYSMDGLNHLMEKEKIL